MTKPNLLELAKQGDAKAIASLINHQLQPKGITAKVILQEACLQVMLESTQVLNQQALVTFVHNGITKLGAASIKEVKIYGRKKGEDLPNWSQEFTLGISEAELKVGHDEQSSNTPQILTVSINLSGDNACGLTTNNFESIANKITNDIFSSRTDIFIQKVSISNGISVSTKER
jgi:hypothetical protein